MDEYEHAHEHVHGGGVGGVGASGDHGTRVHATGGPVANDILVLAARGDVV